METLPSKSLSKPFVSCEHSESHFNRLQLSKYWSDTCSCKLWDISLWRGCCHKPINEKCSRRIETSWFKCIASWSPGFYIMGTFVVRRFKLKAYSFRVKIESSTHFPSESSQIFQSNFSPNNAWLLLPKLTKNHLPLSI